jgi:hypothetical protein
LYCILYAEDFCPCWLGIEELRDLGIEEFLGTHLLYLFDIVENHVVANNSKTSATPSTKCEIYFHIVK